MRLIDADEAIKDAELNYGEVCSVQLMKYFLEKQPTIEIADSGSEGCESCINQHCITCEHIMTDENYEPCRSCSSIHRNYKPTNYCCECGKRLVGID